MTNQEIKVGDFVQYKSDIWHNVITDKVVEVCPFYVKVDRGEPHAPCINSKVYMFQIIKSIKSNQI